MTKHRFGPKVRVIGATLVAVILNTGRSADLQSEIPLHPDREAYFGDLHLHTNYSFDAYFAFGAQIDPDGAYRFARGEPGRYMDEVVVRSTPPLDFLAVTDHSEWVGVMNTLEDANSSLSRSALAHGLRSRNPETLRDLGEWPSTRFKDVPGVDADTISRSAWQRTIAAANRYYEPGKFTTFIAYEWSSMPNLRHLHRNVIFRDDDAPAPFTAMDSIRPEDLWKFLENVRGKGYEALAIPHNSNVSNGLMFDWVDSDGRPIDQAYATQRAANEPLVEISQNKGQSETRISLSPNDEFSNFELLDYLGQKEENKPGGSYVRDALGRGLSISQRTGGSNPYKYGFVGGSDFHNGLSDSAESAYAGTLGATDLSKKLPNLENWPVERTDENRSASEEFTNVLYRTGSGNLTGVWAEQNTRKSIYAALRRKETFATSGSRLRVRFFGSWNLAEDLFASHNWVREAYQNAVPMGADLPAPTPLRHAPVFALYAAKDPDGANLDRIQVIKVWQERGQHVERIYNAALSNARTVDPQTGRAPPVGSSVDLKNGTYTNTIGSRELTALWTDPHFDARVPAVYYLRVLEIPTPRWSTIAAIKRGQPLPKNLPATIQERAWSSPIWYTPLEK